MLKTGGEMEMNSKMIKTEDTKTSLKLMFVWNENVKCNHGTLLCNNVPMFRSHFLIEKKLYGRFQI